MCAFRVQILIPSPFWTSLGVDYQKLTFWPYMGPNRPKWGICRNFYPHFEAGGHVPGVRTYFIQREGVYWVYLKSFDPLTPQYSPLRSHLEVVANRNPESTGIRPKIAFLQLYADFGESKSGHFPMSAFPA